MEIKKIYNLKINTIERPFNVIIAKSLIWRATRKEYNLIGMGCLANNINCLQYQRRFKYES